MCVCMENLPIIFVMMTLKCQLPMFSFPSGRQFELRVNLYVTNPKLTWSLHSHYDLHLHGDISFSDDCVLYNHRCIPVFWTIRRKQNSNDLYVL